MFKKFFLASIGCFDEKTLYRMPTILTIRDVCSPELCQRLCTNHQTCFHFSHQVNSGVCRLKDRETNKEPPKIEFFQFVSGPYTCDGKREAEHILTVCT